MATVATMRDDAIVAQYPAKSPYEIGKMFRLCKDRIRQILAEKGVLLRTRVYLPVVQRECQQCHKEFSTKRPEAKFCDHDCYVAARIARNPAIHVDLLSTSGAAARIARKQRHRFS